LDLLTFRKLAAAFIAPPGLWITVLLLALFFLYRRNRKISSVLIWSTVFFLFFVSSALGEFFLVRPLENDYPPVSDHKLRTLRNDARKTAVVVLSGGVVRGFPGSEPGDVEIGEATLKRVFRGFTVYKSTGFPVLVSGGLEPGAEGIPLAEVMRETLLELGVSREDIIVERSSRTTYENGVNSAAILSDIGFERMVLVTDAVHMRRAVGVFQGRDLDVVPCPSGYLFEQSPELLDFLPNRDSLDDNLRALHEWAGLIYYGLRH